MARHLRRTTFHRIECLRRRQSSTFRFHHEEDVCISTTAVPQYQIASRVYCVVPHFRFVYTVLPIPCALKLCSNRRPTHPPHFLAQPLFNGSGSDRFPLSTVLHYDSVPLLLLVPIKPLVPASLADVSFDRVYRILSHQLRLGVRSFTKTYYPWHLGLLLDFSSLLSAVSASARSSEHISARVQTIQRSRTTHRYIPYSWKFLELTLGPGSQETDLQTHSPTTSLPTSHTKPHDPLSSS
jgi:hypothetical protein